jgi:hypothetical protein
MPLTLPDHVVRDIRLERAAQIALAEANEVCERFTRELRKIDVYLEMVYWPLRNPELPGFVPGCYHVVRHNPTAAGSVEALTGPDGGYMEPGSWVFEMVRRSDMWNVEAERDRARIVARAVAARDRARQREIEDRREELRDRVNAVTRTSVSMTDVPWSQNSAGRRARGT